MSFVYFRFYYDPSEEGHRGKDGRFTPRNALLPTVHKNFNEPAFYKEVRLPVYALRLRSGTRTGHPEQSRRTPDNLRTVLFRDSVKTILITGPANRSLGEGWWRERDSNPRCPFRDIHDFQSCSFDHSDISPINRSSCPPPALCFPSRDTHKAGSLPKNRILNK